MTWMQMVTEMEEEITSLKQEVRRHKSSPKNVYSAYINGRLTGAQKAFGLLERYMTKNYGGVAPLQRPNVRRF